MSHGTQRLSRQSRPDGPTSAATLPRGEVPEYLAPQSIAAVRDLARMIALAEWAPACYRDLAGSYVVAKIELAIMHGAAVGLGPFAAVQSLAVIDGLPSIWGDGAMALVERSGLLEDMREEYAVEDEEGLVAICTMWRRHLPTPISSRFSTAMAEQARLTQKEGPWQFYPRRMLMMRARSWVLRDGFADVLRGLHIHEEIDDYVGSATTYPRPAGSAHPEPTASHTGRGLGRPRFTPSISTRGTTAIAASSPQQMAATTPIGEPRATALAPKRGSDTPRAEPLPNVARDDAPRPKTAIIAPGKASAMARERVVAARQEAGATAQPGIAELEAEQVGRVPELVNGAPAEIVAIRRETEDGAGLSALPPPGALQDARSDLEEQNEAYTLADAEGGFIEVTGGDALRTAFECLFFDRHLVPDQILGLWESNEAARGVIAQLFGAGALDETEARLHAAQKAHEQQRARQAELRHAAGPISPRFPSRTRKRAASSVGPEPELALHIDPSWAEERVFQHYREGLRKVQQNGLGKASTIACFRHANRAIEAQLRTGLPDLIKQIDAIYAWAAKNAG